MLGTRQLFRLVCLFLVSALAACQPAPTATLAPIPPTETPAPTSTSQLTATLTPTPTLRPTRTPRPAVLTPYHNDIYGYQVQAPLSTANLFYGHPSSPVQVFRGEVYLRIEVKNNPRRLSASQWADEYAQCGLGEGSMGEKKPVGSEGVRFVWDSRRDDNLA